MKLLTTQPLRAAFADAFPDRPFTISLWDGTTILATEPGGPTIRATTPRALAYAAFAPNQLGLGRAWVTGALDVDDLDGIIALLDTWKAPNLDRPTMARLAAAAARATGPMLPPRKPASELSPARGLRHSPARDADAVRHRYDVGNDFFRLFLDPETLAYSCAVFSRGATTLAEAQRTKMDLVATKLRLEPGMRVLDVGCGWGSFAIHAAREYGVHVTGITLSPPQAELARTRVAEAGVSDLVDIRVADYRELRAEPFDAIASIGMVEHVGEEQIDVYLERMHSLLTPEGRLLNHGIARLKPGNPTGGAFSERFVFPDGAALQLSRVTEAHERGGMVVDHVEGFQHDYAETLRHWIHNLDQNLEEAERLVGRERLRVWRMYLRGARNGFDTGYTAVYQVLSHPREAPAPEWVTRADMTALATAEG